MIRLSLNKVKLVNLTDHPVMVYDERGDKIILEIPASGIIARCEMTKNYLYDVQGVPVYETSFGAVTGVPPYKFGIKYIVSNVVAQALPGRKDILLPNDIVKRRGVIVGCKSFAMI